jgi:hypothetical protein
MMRTGDFTKAVQLLNTEPRMNKPTPFLATATLLLAMANAAHAQDTVVLPCNSDTLTGTYCYGDNDNQTWHWQSECGDPISLHFTSGTIEMNAYDQLRIYDGPNNTAPVLYENQGPMGMDIDLSGSMFIATSGDIFMELFSNDTISCLTAEGFRSAWEWAWTVTAGTGTAGIAGEQGGNLVLYPNPATSGAQVRVAGLAGGAVDIRIVDVTGRTVHANRSAMPEGGSIGIDLRGLQSGQYSVVLSTPAWVQARKLHIVR